MRFILLVLCLLGFAGLSAQPRASVSYAAFSSPQGTFVDVFITVERASLVRSASGEAAAEFTVTLADSVGIRIADRVRLVAPTTDTAGNFVEALRYPILQGTYQLRVEGSDPYAGFSESETETPATLRLATQVEVAFDKARTNLSDIVLAASYQPMGDSINLSSPLVKAGYLLEPLAQNFVRRQMQGFTAYVEAYPQAVLTGEPLLVEYSVLTPTGDNAATTDEPAVPLMRRNKRFVATDEPTPFLLRINTKKLTSGSYTLRLVVRNKSLQELARKEALFTVANPARDVVTATPANTTFEGAWVQQMTAKELEYALRAIVPVTVGSTTDKIDILLKEGNLAGQRLELYNHFLGESESNPQVAYEAYMDVAREVDYAFQSGFGYGFQTDRGHVYLKYGLPDDRVIVNNDPSAPPYEIWIYNFVELTQQSPGRFLFYNPTLDNASYVMLHSTVRGEVYEPQWRRFLYSRSADEYIDGDSAQGVDIGDNVGRYADQYFTDF